MTAKISKLTQKGKAKNKEPEGVSGEGSVEKPTENPSAVPNGGEPLFRTHFEIVDVHAGASLKHGIIATYRFVAETYDGSKSYMFVLTSRWSDSDESGPMWKAKLLALPDKVIGEGILIPSEGGWQTSEPHVQQLFHAFMREGSIGVLKLLVTVFLSKKDGE